MIDEKSKAIQFSPQTIFFADRCLMEISLRSRGEVRRNIDKILSLITAKDKSGDAQIRPISMHFKLLQTEHSIHFMRLVVFIDYYVVICTLQLLS